MMRANAVRLRPSAEVVAVACEAIVAAVCRAAEYPIDEVRKARRNRYADVRFLVAYALTRHGVRQVDAWKASGINGKAYHYRKLIIERRAEWTPTGRAEYRADRDPGVVRAAMKAAALALPARDPGDNVREAMAALTAEANREGISVDAAMTSRHRRAVMVRCRAMLALRERPLPWAAIAEGLGRDKLTCIRGAVVAKQERLRKAAACWTENDARLRPSQAGGSASAAAHT